MDTTFRHYVPINESNKALFDKLGEKLHQLISLRANVQELLPNPHPISIELDSNSNDEIRCKILKFIADDAHLMTRVPPLVPQPFKNEGGDIVGIDIDCLSRDFCELEMAVIDLRAKILAQFYGMNIVECSLLEDDPAISRMPDGRKNLMHVAEDFESAGEYLGKLIEAGLPYKYDIKSDPNQAGKMKIAVYSYEKIENGKVVRMIQLKVMDK